jgi:hypothetical protein
MADKFPSNREVNIASPLTEWASINPSDSTDLAVRPRALYVGVAGSVVCRSEAGVDVSFNLSAGWHPIRPVRILAAGTTATGLVAGW